MTDPTRVKWFCPRCEVMHGLSVGRAEALTIAGDLLAAGLKMVALYDEAYALMIDQDEAEAAGLDKSCIDTRSALTEWLGTHSRG